MASTAAKLARISLEQAQTTGQLADTTSVLLNSGRQLGASRCQLLGTTSQRGYGHLHLLDTVIDLVDTGNILVDAVAQGHNPVAQLVGTIRRLGPLAASGLSLPPLRYRPSWPPLQAAPWGRSPRVCAARRSASHIPQSISAAPASAAPVMRSPMKSAAVSIVTSGLR